MLSKDELIAFESECASAFERGEIMGPVHLSGGNEDALIRIFKYVRPEDWVFSTWRNHYHALLKGIPPEQVREQIRIGHGMNLYFPEHHFFTSAIVGGIMPIACGVAAAIARKSEDRHVWCFIGDMAASIGGYFDAYHYASGHDLPITFVVEDNGVSCNTPTDETWGESKHSAKIASYEYTRKYPHMGIGKWVSL